MLLANVAQAGSATWNLNPGSGDWNTAGNWTPMTVPNGPGNIATFGLSNSTDLSISSNTEVNSMVFNPVASAFAITVNPSLTLTISGAGITNPGITQNFVTAANGAGDFGHISFTNSATAGTSTMFTNEGGIAFEKGSGGVTSFFNTSAAASGTFTNNGGVGFIASGAVTEFHDNSSAANGRFINNGGIASLADGGATIFNGASTAANGTFINNPGALGTDSFAFGGQTIFHGTSTAANGVFINKGAPSGGQALPGLTLFDGNASAGNGTFINNGGTFLSGTTVGSGGSTDLGGNSTAANGTFINNGGTTSAAPGGSTFVFGNTAANATFINNAGTVSGAFGGETVLDASSGNATIINNAGTVSGAFGGETGLDASSGNATIINNGATVSGANGGLTLVGGSAGNATLIANGGTNGGAGGSIEFFATSTGGASRIKLFGNGNLDISFSFDRHMPHAAVEIGSLEADGNVFLGAGTLAVGSNGLSTTFSGVIQDGGGNGGTGGSLTKIGTGTLDLTGANTYTGGTTINGGVLKVDGSIRSNAFVHSGGTLAGTGTIYGNVRTFNRGTVSPGDSPGTLTMTGNFFDSQPAGTLLIEIAGSNVGEFSVLNVLGSAHLSGILDPMLVNGFVPTVGEEFMFLNYNSVIGGFGKIQDLTFNNGAEHWAVSYQSTNAILTAKAGPAQVPDYGSTLLLLTLSFLALVTYPRQLRH